MRKSRFLTVLPRPHTWPNLDVMSRRTTFIYLYAGWPRCAIYAACVRILYILSSRCLSKSILFCELKFFSKFIKIPNKCCPFTSISRCSGLALVYVHYYITRRSLYNFFMFWYTKYDAYCVKLLYTSVRVI